MNWEPAADGLIRCTRHKNTPPWSPRDAPCAECTNDPGDVIEDETLNAPIEAPEDCRTLEELEAAMVETAEFIDGKSRALFNAGGKGRIHHATAFKGLEVARKYWVAAIEMASVRERRAYVDRLERIHRTMHRRHRRNGAEN